jgi:hypothetical protein
LGDAYINVLQIGERLTGRNDGGGCGDDGRGRRLGDLMWRNPLDAFEGSEAKGNARAAADGCRDCQLHFARDCLACSIVGLGLNVEGSHPQNGDC